MPGSSGAGASGGGGARAASAASQQSAARTGSNNSIADADEHYQRPKSTIDAVEEIQRLYVLESQSDKDLPYDFFTFKQVIDFFIIGFRGAVVESLLFFLIFPVALTVYPAAKAYFMGVTPTIGDYVLPFMLSYSTVLIMTIYVMSAARY